jgi:transcriptional regulator with XRE-family HTH domain
MHRHPALGALGRNLRARRSFRGLTQEKLGELAELDPTCISGIERGIRNPSFLSLLRIASPLGTTVAKLIARTHQFRVIGNAVPPLAGEVAGNPGLI